MIVLLYTALGALATSASLDVAPRPTAATCFALAAGPSDEPTIHPFVEDAQEDSTADPTADPAQDPEEDPEEQYEKKKEEAGDDPQKLWDLYLWCDAFGLEREGRSTLRALLRVDPSHKRAHELLGHIFYDGQWFTSERKLEAYKKKKLAEEREEMEAKGFVRWEDEWVPKEDLPYLERGMVRDDNGRWVDAETAQKLEEGWVRQDLTWIAPEEQDKLEQGLWKCGDEWLTLEEANEYHSSTEYAWTIPTDHFVLHTTCDRALAEKITKTIERAYRDMARIYGRPPLDRAPVVVLNSEAQYNSFAAGNEMTGRPPTEATGLSSVHHAYFADLWMQDDELVGAGVGYWDSDAENGDAWGPHSVRHAAGLSIAEALDPSPEARGDIAKKGMSDSRLRDFYEEKRVPQWFRIGAASYVERYFIDNLVGADGDPEWARKWSIQNLVSKGGLRPLGDILDEGFQSSTPEDIAKWMNELGLVMAFVLDGKCAPVVEAHGRVKAALRPGDEGADEKEIEDAFESLAKQIIAHEKELRTFAGL